MSDYLLSGVVGRSGKEREINKGVAPQGSI